MKKSAPFLLVLFSVFAVSASADSKPTIQKDDLEMGQCPRASHPEVDALYKILDSNVPDKLDAVKAYYAHTPVGLYAYGKDCETVLQRALRNREFGIFMYLFNDVYHSPTLNQVHGGQDAGGEDIFRASLYVYALKFGDISFIRFFKSKGGSIALETPTISWRKSATDLMIVALDNSPTVVSDLLNEGAKATLHDRDSYQQTALFYALDNDRALEIMEMLIQAGAEIDSEDFNGETPLMGASSKEKGLEMVNLLLASGANVHHADHEGDTALINAGFNNENVDVTKRLLAAGANVNQKGRGKRIALHGSAWANKNAEVTRVLLDAGSDIKAVWIESGETPLHCAATNNNVQVITMVLQAGTDVKSLDNDGNTPLGYATRYINNLDVLQALISAGSDVNHINRRNESILDVAKSRGKQSIIQMLVDAGAK